jgi:hypothetical protein
LVGATHLLTSIVPTRHLQYMHKQIQIT